MSRYNIFRILKDLYKEYKTFGNTEIAWIRAETVKLQSDLKQLKLLQAQQRRHEEMLAQQTAKVGVHRLQAIEQSQEALEIQRQVAETVDRLEQKALPAMEEAAQQRSKMKAMAALRASGLANILPQSFGGGGGDDLATIMEPEGSDSGSKHPSVSPTQQQPSAGASGQPAGGGGVAAGGQPRPLPKIFRHRKPNGAGRGGKPGKKR
mmetsp:Transcript_19160/g.57854  ORF Transcript_19160/g.57854 Transcript_19160/m.57854 type:complete len:207 (-) Transcript_19160:1443-2063(-)